VWPTDLLKNVRRRHAAEVTHVLSNIVFFRLIWPLLADPDVALYEQMLAEGRL
jgi:hypothetical protein